MRIFSTFTALIIGLVLMGCGGTSDLLDTGRSVSETYTISGTAFDSDSRPVVGVMGLWDITTSEHYLPDYTAEISDAGEFVFSEIPENHSYYVWVWETELSFKGWITNRSPYFYNLSSNQTINFFGIL